MSQSRINIPLFGMTYDSVMQQFHSKAKAKAFFAKNVSRVNPKLRMKKLSQRTLMVTRRRSGTRKHRGYKKNMSYRVVHIPGKVYFKSI